MAQNVPLQEITPGSNPRKTEKKECLNPKKGAFRRGN
jgi:hypothetical protein